VAINFYVGGLSTIWTADSAGGNLRQLTTEGLEEFDPWNHSWSPDGSEFAYLSRHTGTADIWVMPVNGGPARQLTNELRDDTQPVWSPDGRWVAFVSTRGQQTDVWVVPSTGGEAIRATDDAAEEGRLQWIGPGTRLGFQTSSASSTLWALDAGTGTERQVTPDSIRVGGFRVSPDGSEVAYVVERGGGVTDLQVVPLAGGPPRVLVAGSNENRLAGWSPDGQTILYESNRGGNVDLWTVSTAGGAPTKLTNWPTYETNPVWTPDGSGIYFLSDRDATLRDIWLVPATGGEPRRITTVGSVNAITQSSSSPDLFVILLGGRAGQFVLARLEADGSLRTLWDRSNVGTVSPDAVMPGADSVVINAGLAEGGEGSFLISTRTGQGRQLLGKDETAADFSRDGTMLAYTFGGATQDLGILDMKDGTTRRLTNTPEREAGYWWAGDTKTIVVARRSQRSRIATVDLGPLLERGR
jgi:Tol biopolymer transport system component